MLLKLMVIFISVVKCKPQTNNLNVLEAIDRVLRISGEFEIPSYETSNKGRGPFDYVVVGAGTAGSVLASRLSENPNTRVLLLEAGDNPPRVSDVPFIASYMQLTKYNWDYELEKQDNFALGMVNQRMRWPRGKVLGGSSVLNSMMHTRGNKHDYDRWAAMGNPGWSYKDVLPYFMKSENSTVKIQDRGYHNSSGYLNVQDIYLTELGKVFIEGAMEMGHPYVDYNGKNQMGVSAMQVTIRDGRRCSSEKAFLRPARHRKNLVIRKNSLVSRVVVNKTTKAAYGVEYVTHNQTYMVSVRKEVILSAGVLRSPQILMLSGIGPKDHVEEMKVPLVHDLPVGKKMYDHLLYLGLLFSVDKKIVVTTDDLTIRNILNFTLKGAGLLTAPDVVQAILFMKTSAANYTEDYPDIELVMFGTSMHTLQSSVYERILNIKKDVFSSVWRNPDEKFTWTVFPLLLHPKSFGYLQLRSNDPFDKVKIYGNYFTDPENQDMRTMIAGIREVQKIVRAPAFRKYGTRQVKNVVLGCNHLRYDSDEYWECAVRHVANTVHHQTTTCKMGPASDPEAVVDHNLRVHGIKNLRVVDTSVIPIPLSAHTNVPAYMLAEKASDLILQVKDSD